MTSDYAAEMMGGAVAEAVRAAVAAERARREAAEAECARLRVELEATERARREAEEERDTVLELVADDAVDAARARDDRDAARLAALATLRVALSDAELILEERERQLTAAVEAFGAERTRREAAEASATRSADAAVDAVRELGHVAAAAVARADAAEARLAALAAAVREERAVTAACEHAWARHITADDLAGAEEVLALDARLDAARAALDAALGAT